MSNSTSIILAIIFAIGTAGATISFQGLPNEQTGYIGAEYFIHFESGADMVFGGQSGPGAMFTYNNLPLTDEQYQSDLAEGFAAYDAFKNPVVDTNDGQGNTDTGSDDSSTPADDGNDVTVPPVDDSDSTVVDGGSSDDSSSVPVVPSNSGVVRIEGTDTYFVGGQEMHVINPKYARSVQCTVGSGFASQ